MNNKILLGIKIFVAVLNANCQVSKERAIEVDINDSTSVRKLITDFDLCEKLMYIENNKSYFINNKGYAILILKNVSKETNKPFFLTIANGGILESEKNRLINLQDEVEELKNLFKCNSK